MTKLVALVVDGHLCGLALTVGEACSTIATAVRISLLDWSPRPATGGHYGCFRVTAGFPSGIGSILTTLVLRPHENRKTLHAQRIQRAAADLSAGCPRPSVVSQMCLPQDRRSATGLSNRPGCVPSPHPDSCPRRSSCITAPYPYPKAKGARWFARDQSPEATPVLWRYTSTKVAYYDTGPPKSRPALPAPARGPKDACRSNAANSSPIVTDLPVRCNVSPH
jgi:hypothetical protein